MNIVKKAYCRTFQTVFKWAIPVLPYRSPKRLKKAEDIAPYLKKKNINNVLIVTDNFIHKSGMLKPLKEALEKYAIEYSVFDETVANPTVANVEKARSMYLGNSCKALIGFGGGSSIDCAKAVGARVVKPNQPIRKMKGILKIWKKLPLLIAVPTTAGTGSEVTLASVITDGETRHKFPINDFFLIPKVAVLDPELTRSLPKNLTATTGMDALTHAVEAYIGRSVTRDTHEDSIKAVNLIFANLEKAYEDGDDMKARANMLRAAFLAGRAFTKSYVGYCHAVAHSLGGKYNTPHGLANAVLLPYTLELYGESVYEKLGDLAKVTGVADKSLSDEEASKLFIHKIRTMNKNMGIPEKLSGIEEEDIVQLSTYAEKEANPLYPVPKLMTRKELEKLYYDVMEES
ncbi:MAG: iron-containing alcohol dehydrogenase [Lachnospiraceae bacterium]|nr:iron-containing alcohol dehydrogenase [Lachnospiraceae bacterium]